MMKRFNSNPLMCVFEEEFYFKYLKAELTCSEFKYSKLYHKILIPISRDRSIVAKKAE